ncbi:hypothetical protein HT031_002518 [Scenedesmus sp. PABB004]|nr:hypothetical protein HT031_002518 [Scenedesmus sp. PABB004]
MLARATRACPRAGRPTAVPRPQRALSASVPRRRQLLRASADAAAPPAPAVAPQEAITLTDAALAHIRKMRAEAGGEALLLRVGVKQGGCSGLSYVMDFEAEANLAADDYVIQHEGFKLAVDPKSLLYLFGLRLDFSDALIGGGFQFHNPNSTDACGCGKSFGVFTRVARATGAHARAAAVVAARGRPARGRSSAPPRAALCPAVAAVVPPTMEAKAADGAPGGMSEEDKFAERRRDVLVLVLRFLVDCGFPAAYQTLVGEAGVSLEQADAADNIDLMTIVQEFVDFYFTRFGRYPKLIRHNTWAPPPASLAMLMLQAQQQQAQAQPQQAEAAVAGAAVLQAVSAAAAAAAAAAQQQLPLPEGPGGCPALLMAQPAIAALPPGALPPPALCGGMFAPPPPASLPMPASLSAGSDCSMQLSATPRGQPCAVQSVAHAPAAAAGSPLDAPLVAVRVKDESPESATQHAPQRALQDALQRPQEPQGAAPGARGGVLSGRPLQQQPQLAAAQVQAQQLDAQHAQPPPAPYPHPTYAQGTTYKLGPPLVEGPLSQDGLVAVLSAVQPGAAPSRHLSFRIPARPKAAKRSDRLAASEVQEEAMYALVGCADVGWSARNISPATRAFLEAHYGIDRGLVTTFFKNRSQRRPHNPLEGQTGVILPGKRRSATAGAAGPQPGGGGGGGAQPGGGGGAKAPSRGGGGPTGKRKKARGASHAAGGAAGARAPGAELPPLQLPGLPSLAPAARVGLPGGADADPQPGAAQQQELGAAGAAAAAAPHAPPPIATAQPLTPLGLPVSPLTCGAGGGGAGSGGASYAALLGFPGLASPPGGQGGLAGLAGAMSLPAGLDGDLADELDAAAADIVLAGGGLCSPCAGFSA